MKIYVAGKYQERQYVRYLMSQLVEMGHTITCDWTDQSIYPPDYITFRSAVDDINAIRDCDIYIGIFLHKLAYRGSLVEMGAALISGKPTYILGHAFDGFVFIYHPLVRVFDTEEELLDALRP